MRMSLVIFLGNTLAVSALMFENYATNTKRLSASATTTQSVVGGFFFLFSYIYHLSIDYVGLEIFLPYRI